MPATTAILGAFLAFYLCTGYGEVVHLRGANVSALLATERQAAMQGQVSTDAVLTPYPPVSELYMDQINCVANAGQICSGSQVANDGQGRLLSFSCAPFGSCQVTIGSSFSSSFSAAPGGYAEQTGCHRSSCEDFTVVCYLSHWRSDESEGHCTVTYIHLHNPCQQGCTVVVPSPAPTKKPKPSPAPTKPQCTLGKLVATPPADCSTSRVFKLSKQVDEIMGAAGMGISFENSKVSCINSNACKPFLQKKAAEALQAVAAADLKDAKGKPLGKLMVNSAFRSVTQQYLLHGWYKAGKCRITEAAMPGNSRHERLMGVDIDIDIGTKNQAIFKENGWIRYLGEPNVAHFDYKYVTPIPAESLRAFQKLWNQHAGPADRIPQSELEDIYVYGSGSKTDKAFANAPCDGW